MKNKHQLLDILDKSSSINYPKDKTIIDLFLDQVARTPNETAVVFENHELSYREINKLSNQFAEYLINTHSVIPGDLVCLMLDRSEWLIVCILGTLKTGAAYVPIDPTYPSQRINYIKNDSKCKVIIDSLSLENFQHKKEKLSFKESYNTKIHPNSLCYIIYTSGTTGNPKGVMIEHQNVVRLFFNDAPVFNFNSKDVWTMFHSFCFDFSIWEMFGALLFGGKLIVVPELIIKDSFEFLSLIEKEGVTVLNQTPSAFINLMNSINENDINLNLRYIIFGGEALYPKYLEKWYRKFPNIKFINMYGITETTVHVTYKEIGDIDIKNNISNIGNCIPTLSAYILNDFKKIQPIGSIGELFVSGPGLARGYLNKPELTNERFIANPFKHGERMYRTGDLARWLPNGDIEYIGRKDDQVKIRGHRIELGEIETILNAFPNINRAVVLLSNHIIEEPCLVAYIQFNGIDEDLNKLRKKLKKIVPEFLIPSIFMKIKTFPITSNGKIDKKNLPKPEYVRPDSAPLFKKASTQLEKDIVKIWSVQLQIPDIGVDDNFFEMGGTSLLSQKVVNLIRKKLKLNISVTKIYQYPTVSSLSKHIELKENTANYFSFSKQKENLSEEVAIIGMAGRFPGASSIDELWEILSNGKETISFFKPDELDKTIPKSLRNDPLYVKARGIVPSAKEFDAKFFGINPKLAEAMDPQQRLFLEIAWEALEQTGYLPKHYKGNIGVYAGTGTNTYYKNNIFPNTELLNQIGHLQVNTVNEKDYIATRTAYHLNLKGPAVSIHSACSTSLLAIAEAVKAIRNGQCDIALAGGSSVTSPINSGHLYQEGSMLSSDGHCRSFDTEAKGTVFSDGAGVVLLKNMEAAISDGDYIYGKIKGVGINNDGGAKGSFTAPSVDGQADAISRALNDAKVSPSTISYVETHGTATPLGDPIEIEGLHNAFGKQNTNNYCAIGSIKSNMGHLTAAAGVAGLIKTILSIDYKQIPPSLGFKKPNPSINFKNSPFFVNTKLRDWNIGEGVRRAGISSFGVGGTNVHIIVEEHIMNRKVSDKGRSVQLLPWSAKSETSLKNYGNELANFIKNNSSVSLADLSYTLKITKDSFKHRKFILAGTNIEASEKLLKEETNISSYSTELKIIPNEIIFLFPGQGSQFLNMGKALYLHENVFRKAVDTCNEFLISNFKIDIKQIIYSEDNSIKAENKLKNTRFTQPALFVVEYALAKLWMSWGIQPTVFCGHSIGEFVGAHLAGIFSLEDALKLITIRGKLVSELPKGSMLSIRLSKKELDQVLPNTLSIAAINSDKLCVVSGLESDIHDFSITLKKQNIPCQLLATSHAFHSAMMNPILETFNKEVEKIKLNAPKIPIISTVTGTFLTDSEAINPEYWTNHLRETVQFSKAMDSILKLDDSILLEVGPGKVLTTLARQKRALKSRIVLSSLTIPKKDEDAYPELLNTLGQLWLNGIEPNWNNFYKGQLRQKLRLPTYIFDRKPCWVDPIEYNQPTNINTLNTDIPLSKLDPLTEDTNKITPMRKPIILKKISELILNASGIELENSDYNYNFLELGLDSLILTQIAITCKKEFKTPITFRQLNEEYNTPELLASYLDARLPNEMYSPVKIDNSAQNKINETVVNIKPNNATYDGQNNALNLIAQQIQLLGKQVELMQENGSIPNTQFKNNTFIPTPENTNLISDTNILSKEEQLEHKKPFGASPKIEKQSTGLSDKQNSFLTNLIQRYNKKTIGSKTYSQKHRAKMADPRVVTGFKPKTKELIYPLVIEKSSGNRLWDLDGNEYIDALNGFGSCFFGHQPEFIKEALHKQIENGFEVGPQHPLAGEVCNLLCEFTGHERAGLCNTGSEAVLGAMRIARTVTGRSLIVAFSGSYHGINDEGIVRGSKKLMTFPAAAGILPEAVKNMLILEYGTEESLNIIRERANELAAVLVEPVQSRRPEFQPINFLKKVREITTNSKTALIFDEVITGFRMHPGGTQSMFDIKADIATYGKVIGGGISIGAILGKKEYMDALDGGFWQYNDNSYPEVGVTYFAGTFVRHPLALASTKASLNFLKEKGPELQKNLNDMTEALASELNNEFQNQNLPIEITYFGSLWRLKFLKDIPYSELLFVLLREKGIHIWDGFPCFLTLAYTEQDIKQIINAFKESIKEMTQVGFFHSELMTHSLNSNYKKQSAILNTPPKPNARLGIDEKGNPAWFIHEADNGGKYVKIEI